MNVITEVEYVMEAKHIRVGQLRRAMAADFESPADKANAEAMMACGCCCHRGRWKAVTIGGR